jgi:hypothetical protein
VTFATGSTLTAAPEDPSSSGRDGGSTWDMVEVRSGLFRAAREF